MTESCPYHTEQGAGSLPSVPLSQLGTVVLPILLPEEQVSQDGGGATTVTEELLQRHVSQDQEVIP